MAGAKLMVLYPLPKDSEAFEEGPIRTSALPWSSPRWPARLSPSEVLASPQGTPAFYRIAEVHFPSMQALEACARSEGGKQTLAHAGSISSAEHKNLPRC